MRGKKLALGLLASALVSGLLMTVPQQAGAEPITSISLKPINTKCTNKTDRIRWRGGEAQYAHIAAVDARAKGSMYTCWSVYKVREDRKRFDWWVAYLETRWFNAKGDYVSKAPAEMTQSIYSSQYAADHTESGTGSFVSEKECGTPFTVSAGFYGVGVSTTQQLCEEYRVKRLELDANNGVWRAFRVGKVDRVETVYMQKVRAGAGRPTFRFFVLVPRYTYEHNGAVWMRNENYRWVERKI